MTKKCGNCTYWKSLLIGFPSYCTSRVNEETIHENLSDNNPEYCCPKHELEPETRALIVQYPARFLERV